MEGELGSSLPVPCVQELAKELLTTVPPRYVRFDDQHSPLMYDSDNVAFPPQVPVIDMERLFSQEYMDLELENFHYACQEWGFFQLINHGVSSSLVEKLKMEIQNFFNLPMEEKKKYWQKPGEMEGFGQAFVVSEDQKLDWADMFNMVTLPAHLRKSHLFPELPIQLREVLEAYSEETKNLAKKIINLIVKALSIRPDEIGEFFEDMCQSMRMNYYPPCPKPELVLGLNSHSDAGGLAVLLQVNETEGLQIKKDNMWIPIKPLSNAFIINFGDMLEVVTNGKYRSIEHRATVNSDKERISIATFHTPNMNKEIGPAPSMITPETPALFRRIGVADYLRGYFSRELKGKSYLDVIRVQNDDAKAN